MGRVVDPRAARRAANFHRIQRELLFGDAPSSELGRIDERFRTEVQKLEPTVKTA